MHWIAPSAKDVLTETLEKRLWASADQFRANSGFKAQEYSGPILGIIFLRFAEVRFTQQRAKLERASASSRRGSCVDEPAAYHAEGILYLASDARFDFLLNLPEAKDIGLCRAATLKEIEAQGWSLNPGRYVGVARGEAVSDEDFKEQLETLNEELETLNAAARELETTIASNVTESSNHEHRSDPYSDFNIRSQRPADRNRRRILAGPRSPAPAWL